MMSQGSWLAVVISFAIALVLELIQLPQLMASMRPEWLVLAVLFWTLRSPDLVGIGVGFVVGLLLDIVGGNFLGINALALSIVCYLAVGLHKRIKHYPLFQQALIAVAAVLIHLFIVHTFKSLLSRGEDFSALLLIALASGLVWPFVVVLYDRINMALRW